MGRPPILAYHVVFGAYGFWLPNDPRGSWSKYVWSSRLQPFGRPKYGRRYATTRDDEILRVRMKKALRRPPVRFTGEQARAVGRGMAEIVNEMRLVVYAAAIMPDHVHIVAARQELYAETLAGYLKRAAARKLGEEGLHPFADQEGDAGDIPSCWERGGWKVFLHTVDEIEPAVLYVQNNPPEAGLPLQQWSFVSRFES